MKKRTKQWIQDEHTKEVLKSNHPISEIKKEWFHDKLLHKTPGRGMRLLRKMRLGVSYLNDHTYFLKTKKSRKCQNCKEGKNENNAHFLLHCKKFQKQRKKMMKELKQIGILNPDLPTLMNGQKKPSPSTMNNNSETKRLKIIGKVIEFILDTKRFHHDI